MARRVLVPLAEGFEEIEAVTIIDVLRRADIEVVVAGLRAGAVRGAHGIEVSADTVLANVDGASFDVLVLPGGQPGTKNLSSDLRVLELVRQICARGGTVAAICAAPSVLADAGILGGVQVTSHPSVRSKLGDALVLDQPRVVRSGSIITSQGAGTAMEFALALVAQFAGEDRAAEIARAMVAAR